MDNLSKAKEEVTRFCEQIEGWFQGNERITAIGILANFSSAFRMISPDGSRRNMADLEAWLPQVFGRFPRMRVTLKNIQGHATDYHVLLTYTEVQDNGEGVNTRHSSAVFIRDGDRMLWLDLWERS
ncbi:hypothetical protein SAMN04488128_1011900 [Chitinophaga eiseniae]|uniref:DUF4440 domain-containing protein n=1 Tax=Chitinophaga eiseniae TaxID=634771 RepID=A0A1T4P3T1_9BACT|nr:hypothetical protein [Chitinophaga eiseniae]SJZ86173.1 hypothetical protein SAMN04488128_1011900 [Chitinophaga eiseniae]